MKSVYRFRKERHLPNRRRRFGLSSPIPRASTRSPARRATVSKNTPTQRAASTASYCQGRTAPAALGGRLRRVAGKPPPQPDARIPQRSVPPFQCRLRPRSGRHRNPAGVFGESSASACSDGWPECRARSTAKATNGSPRSKSSSPRPNLRQIPGASAEAAVKPAARRRFDALIAELDRDPASHGLAPKLSDFLLHAPTVPLGSIRPLAMARSGMPRRKIPWNCSSPPSVGILAMGWDLLCPRCRGAKSSVRHLHELPQRRPLLLMQHRLSARFHPQRRADVPSRTLAAAVAKGELCMLGQGSTPHVKFQAEIAAHSRRASR